eukprot:TRINITY_DN8920_c0_g1_i3.p1 TRINITY_DN8920_c0_g1~~TRINITY_DN8920_c0_g1_i3.p1  ORF type:complete len:864 (+),score=173.35 TRINITY_DN8920_c0_g1_i3:46-2592(+)
MEQESCFRDNLLDLFKAWDTNQNGYIEESELSEAIASLGMASSDIREMLTLADANKDGRIDYTEFCNWLVEEAPAKVQQLADRADTGSRLLTRGDHSLSVTVTTITGSVILSNFQMLPKDRVKDLLAETVRSKPLDIGYTYQLCYGDRVLQESVAIGEAGICDGADVTAVLMPIAGVRTMVDRMKKTVSFMKANPDYFNYAEEDESEEDGEDDEEEEEEDGTYDDAALQAALGAVTWDSHERTQTSFDDAMQALNTLDRKDISEIKAMASPPMAVDSVVHCVWILRPVASQGPKYTWRSEAKAMLANHGLVEALRDYDCSKIKIRQIIKVKALLDAEPVLTENRGSQMRTVSKAGFVLLQWVLAIIDLVMSVAPPEALDILVKDKDTAPTQSVEVDDEDEYNWEEGWNEGFSQTTPLYMLKRLGPLASSAAHYFAKLLQEENKVSKEIGVWCLGMVGAAAVPFFSEIVKATRHSLATVSETAARSLVLLSKAGSLNTRDDEMLTRMVLDEVRATVRKGQCSQATRLLIRRLVDTAVEADLEDIFRMVLCGCQQKNRMLIRHIARKRPTAFRRLTKPDLCDEIVWQQSTASLERRLAQAKDQREAKRQAQYEQFASRCRGSEEREALDKMWRVSSRQLQQQGADPNEIAFQGWVADYDPLQLRANVHANQHAYDPAVTGEAGWHCLEPHVIKADIFAPGQKPASRQLSPTAQLRRRSQLKARSSSLYRIGDASEYCIAKHENAEGGDPLQSWLFPDRSRSPKEDFELPAVPRRPVPSWFYHDREEYENQWLDFELEAALREDNERDEDDEDYDEDYDEDRALLPPVQDCAKLLVLRPYPHCLEEEEEEE